MWITIKKWRQNSLPNDGNDTTECNIEETNNRQDEVYDFKDKLIKKN